MANRDESLKRTVIPGLRGIEKLIDTEKTARITIIAGDIKSAVVQISRMRDAGLLRSRNTRPIEDVIDTIGVTDGQYRRQLERQLKRQDRSLKNLKRRHGEEMGELVKGATIGFEQLRRRTERLGTELKVSKRRLVETELQLMAAVAGNERRHKEKRQMMERMGVSGCEDREPDIEA